MNEKLRSRRKTSFSCQLKIQLKFTLFLIFLFSLKPRQCSEKYSLWFTAHICFETITPVKFHYQFKSQLLFSEVVAETHRHRMCLQTLHQLYHLQVHVLLVFIFCCFFGL